jgi:hypothetical protein
VSVTILKHYLNSKLITILNKFVNITLEVYKYLKFNRKNKKDHQAQVKETVEVRKGSNLKKLFNNNLRKKL